MIDKKRTVKDLDPLDVGKTDRLIEGLKNKQLWGASGLITWLAKESGYSLPSVGRILNKRDMAPSDKFLIAACRSAGINHYWVETGNRPYFSPTSWSPIDAPLADKMPINLVPIKSLNRKTSPFDKSQADEELLRQAIENTTIRQIVEQLTNLTPANQYRVLAICLELAEAQAVHPTAG